MNTRTLLYVAVIVALVGCSQSPPTPVVSTSTRTIVVSSDDPHLYMDDGTIIGVDGVPSGQSLTVWVTEMRDSNGQVVEDIDTAPEKTSN